MSSHVVVRTHGGLGNQLFQMLFARLVAEQCGQTLLRVHDARYRHGFAASPLFDDTPTAGGAIAALSALRLPKLAHRVFGSEDEVVRLPGVLLIDGYFQRREQYAAFAPASIACEIQRLRFRLGVGGAHAAVPLSHIRLGDFFGSEDGQREHLEMRLAGLQEGCDIVTNRDDLLAVPAARELLAVRRCRHVATAHLAPEALLALMASYPAIHANDSTLSFWAALLGGGSIAIAGEGLAALLAALRAASHGQYGVAPNRLSYPARGAAMRCGDDHGDDR